MTWAHIAGGLFVLWGCASWLWSAAPHDTWGELLILLIYAGTFLLGTRIRDLQPFWVGAALGIGVNSVAVLLDWSGLITYEQYSRPSGLFVNGLNLAEAAVLVLVGGWSIMWMRGPGLALIAPSILLVPLARGPLLALGAVGLAWLWGRSKRWTLIVACVGAAALLLGWLYRPSTVEARISMWVDAASNLTFMGHGFGSYFHLAPLIGNWFDVGVNVERHPHNVFLEIAFELGLPGLLLAGAFCALILIPMRGRAVLCAFMIEACLGFPFSLPATGGIFMLVAGHVSRDLPDWRLSLDRCRDIVCGRPGL
jgi:hypothetical protein